MDTAQIDSMLRRTLDDERLSRGERKALAAVLSEVTTADRDLDVVRSRAFAVAGSVLGTVQAHSILAWLEEVVTVLEGLRRRPVVTVSGEACFAPGDACRNRLVGLLRGATATIDACVYTVTDDRIATALLGAHRRGVVVRLLTDDVKATDLGSDVDRLESAGIPVAVDRGPGHMHHKFVVVDGRTLAAGSYNWTRSAATDNHEDLLVTDHPRLVVAFAKEFDTLWQRYQ